MLESADSMLRNKRVQPMNSTDTVVPSGRKRKVYIPQPSEADTTHTDKGNGELVVDLSYLGADTTDLIGNSAEPPFILQVVLPGCVD